MIKKKNSRESINAGSSGQNYNTLVDLNEKPPAKPPAKKWCIV